MDSKVYMKKSLGDTGLDLLEELCNICDDNRIDYYLAPKMVLRSVFDLDFDTYFTMPEIYMKLEGVLRLLELIENNMPAGRALDYLGNNSNYSSFNVSYVNTETTAINLTRGEEFSQHGIKVTINIIRNDIKKRLPGIVETGREANAFKAHGRGNWKKALGERVVAHTMKAGGSGYNKGLFNYYVKHYSKCGDSERVFIRRFRMKRMYFDRKLFDEKKKVELNGRAFWSVKDTAAMLERAYGKDIEAFRDRLVPYKSKKVITSTMVPFKDYMDSLQKMGTSVESVFEQENAIRASNLANKKIRKAIGKIFILARMSEQRFLMYPELHSRIEEIRTLRASGDYESLAEIFKEYDKQAIYFLAHGYALCLDEELFEVECELMEHSGREKKAEKMRRLVFEEHKKPLTAK